MGFDGEGIIALRNGSTSTARRLGIPLDSLVDDLLLQINRTLTISSTSTS
jgi:hypothetical protein